MENASKALIIAGAILIAILLISVGILVMNSMNKPIDQAQSEADSQAVRIFNAKFESYLGGGQSASSTKYVMSLVNSTEGVSLDTASGAITDVTTITNGSTYKVSPTFDSATGKIKVLTITKEP